MSNRLNVLVSILFLCFLSTNILADNAALKEKIQTHFPGEEIQSLKKTPYLGLYEVAVGGELFYTDETVDYFFFGHVIDTMTRTSLTNVRLQEIKNARRIAIDSLPLEHAIKTSRGNGKRSVAVFTDPHCPYCKQLEKQLVNVTDITIYTFLYPVLNGSVERSTKIWCSDDKLKAWDDYMLRDIAPTGKDCETPLSTLVQLGREHKITGTPTLIFADGTIVGGLIPTEQIEERLNNALKE
ncbi:MAG: DsbC family protein [Nitrosomonas sp.]|nr:DsbC family protein [Nitrosomonas sp.]